MAELKTKATTASVSAFLGKISDPERRKDAKAVASIMKTVTRAKPVMWGDRIVGFGYFQYSRSNGDTFKWFLAGFAPKSAAMVVYLIGGSDKALLKKLGKHKLSGSCLHIRRLDDVDQPTLKKLVAASVKNIAKRFGSGERRA
jgi:hypothetical protein